MRFFALKGSEDLGAAVANAMGIAPDPHEERDFEDGEHKSRPLISVRGEDVYILLSLHGRPELSANDKLVRLLFFIAACRDNGAGRVTAIVPYLAYSRKDRQTKPRDPVNTRYVAQLFEAMGVDAVATLEVHNVSAFQNAFRCLTVHLDTHALFAAEMAKRAEGLPVVVFSPDSGGVKRAQLLKEAYDARGEGEAGFGFADKRRSGGVVSGELFAGEVAGAAIFVIDDIVSSGGTVLRAAKACRARGAKKVFVLATHGLFSDGSAAVLADPAIDRTIVTDSAMPFPLPRKVLEDHVDVISVAALIASAIMHLHGGGSIHRLLAPEA